MRATNKQLTLLSEAEKSAFYECPDFDEEQRLEYLTLTDEELQLASQYTSLSARVYCILQIGYFKAVKLFFHVNWDDVDRNDLQFILQQYFPNKIFHRKVISKHEYYAQRKRITEFFGYRLWRSTDTASMETYAASILQRDTQASFVTLELLSYLQTQKIIRPGYTTLQAIVSGIVNNERQRLAKTLQDSLTAEEKNKLKQLLTNNITTPSPLALLKQDAKNFNARIMSVERDKLILLRPLYHTAKRLLSLLKLSQQNIQYYASLVEYYSIYDLRRLKEQTPLYLLCYAWKRYRQLQDNLMSAFEYQFKKLEKEAHERAKKQFSEQAVNQSDDLIVMKYLAGFYVDDGLPDDLPFGSVREKVFAIVPREELQKKIAPQKLQQVTDFYWKIVDSLGMRMSQHLRPIIKLLDFSGTDADNPCLKAIRWMVDLFEQNKSLSQQKITDCPSLSKPLSYFTQTEDKASCLRATRYEFWVYRQLYHYFKAGQIFLEDSLKYRSLRQELVSLEDKEALIQALKIPAFDKPIGKQLDILLAELTSLWKRFNQALKRGELKHLRYDEKDNTLHMQKISTTKEEKVQHHFYEQLPLRDIADILRFVHQRCHFFSAFTHIQPRYAKQSADLDYLIATLIAQAMNNGNFHMAEISDLSYDTLQETYQSHFRLSTLKAACDKISNDIADMPIFPTYSFDMKLLYGGVDGQKLEVETPTIRARYSKKYYRKGTGVVAYTLLANHIPLQTELISPNEHESYFVFDIWYNNTSNISPDIITGDMHVINRANFAIMYFFGGKLYPRFTDIHVQCKHLYASDDLSNYHKYLIQPVGVIDRQLIEQEWPNLQRIIASLGLKETTQSTLVKKLCTYKQEHQTRKALFEFDKLIRSIHTLKCLLDPTMQRNSHRSQNRVEAYHQLRGAIAQAYGKKQLLGKTDIALEISNQCGRLVANTIIHYNSAILSKLYEKYQADGNKKAVELLKKVSPAAWRHIHFHGHFVFSEAHLIDLDEIIQKLILMPKNTEEMVKNYSIGNF